MQIYALTNETTNDKVDLYNQLRSDLSMYSNGSLQKNGPYANCEGGKMLEMTWTHTTQK